MSRYSDIIEQVKESCDIVDVIGKYVDLKREGRNYKGLCPFHSEKTPSFIVSQEKQIFTCFGCGETGNVIGFIQRIENIDFMDAVAKLAEEAGIEIKKPSGKAEKKKDDMYELNRMAAIHFYKNLRENNNEGLKYVVSRGISPETAVKFGIGYAKNGWNDMADFLKSKGISEQLSLEAGLLSKNDKRGNCYDKFRDRVIFPIKNTRDKVIGFGGRVIGEGTPKYLNSPESIIFKKKDNLYGLNLAKNEIRKKNLAIIVEGYMDVISLVEAGFENVVASLGTALTHEQAKLLKRYTDTVVLSYDSDGAGQAAAMRGIDILREAGLKVKILVIDDGKDPDEFIRKNGKKAFEELIEKSVSFMEYKIESIKKKYDMNTTDGSIGFLEEISNELKKVKSPVEQATYVKLVSEITHIPESSINREIEGFGRETKVTVSEEPISDMALEKPRKTESYKVPVVKFLIKLMIGNGKYIKAIADNPNISDYFYGSGYEKILEQLVMNYSEDREADINSIMDGLNEYDAALMNDIIENVLPINDEDEMFMQCAKKIITQQLNKKRYEDLKILEILDEDKDEEQIKKLTEEIMYINNRLKELN